MAIAKRVVLFLAVNFLVVLCISFLMSILNIQPYLTRHGLNIQSLAIFCLIWGMAGAMISLFLSKQMAKWTMGVQIIDPDTRDPGLRSIVDMVYRLADKAGLPKRPEVGIYESPEVNAFATGPSKSNSLVAVSTGLLRRMQSGEVEGVLGHEITHVANGDMVTMTLLQGVINAFVMFLARILAFAISRLLAGRREDESADVSPLMFQGITMALEIVFMILGAMVVASFSRFREFRADAGGARLAGKDNMISALEALKKVYEIQDPKTDSPAFQAFKISSPGGFTRWFASHPPLDERIARLKGRSLS
jgi:heat shock protein HtpX